MISMIGRLAVAFGALSAGVSAEPSLAASVPQTVIRNVTILDPQTGRETAHMDVVIRGEMIARVHPASRRSLGASEVDGRGKFLMPGLWDSHVHLFNLTSDAFPLMIANGITSVRDMGGDPAELARWRKAITQGRLIGPRIKYCGPMLEEPNGTKGLNHRAVGGPGEARATVAELVAAGVDCIKMRSVKDMETYRALAEAAHQAQVPVVGHAPFALDPVQAAALGQQTIEHAFYPYPFATLPQAQRTKILTAFRASGVRIAPTMVAWEPSMRSPAKVVALFKSLNRSTAPKMFISPSVYGNWQEGMTDFGANPRGSQGWINAIRQAAADAKTMYDFGIPILAGTDLGAPFVSPATALYDELDLLVSLVGLTPTQALAAATWEPATLFGETDRLGSVKAGKYADLLLLNADPFKRISNIRSIDIVFTRGRRYGPAARARMKAVAVQGLLRQWRKQPAKPSTLGH